MTTRPEDFPKPFRFEPHYDHDPDGGGVLYCGETSIYLRVELSRYDALKLARDLRGAVELEVLEELEVHESLSDLGLDVIGRLDRLRAKLAGENE